MIIGFLPPARLGQLALAMILALVARPAAALPSFAAQTNQPCAACHVGAFGPQLKPFGRDFKLYGYTATDGKDHGPPIAATAMASFTRTASSQPGGAAPGFAATTISRSTKARSISPDASARASAPSSRAIMTASPARSASARPISASPVMRRCSTRISSSASPSTTRLPCPTCGTPPRRGASPEVARFLATAFRFR